MCLCACVSQGERERARTERMKTEAQAERDKQALCMWCSLSPHLYFEARSHTSTGPCTDHSEEVHINYVMLISH